MARHPWLRGLAVVLACAAAAAIAGPAGAAPAAPGPPTGGTEPIPAPSVPVDVAELAAGTLAAQVQASLADTVVVGDGVGDMSAVPDWSGDLAVGAVHQLYRFATEWIWGDAITAPVVANQEWLAPLILDGTPVGAVRVWLPDGTAEMAGFDDNAVLGASLEELDPSVILIEDAVAARWYSLVGDMLTPVRASSAPQQITAPITLGTARSMLYPGEYSEDGQTWPAAAIQITLVVVLAAAVPAAMTVSALRRRRQARVR
ncbi:hypothetical protein RN607_04850 [Demequina capsici]|uniref:Uncharacterized protein n=1 Tax=Demequina capsici TaxID=3075620 RepID=A0AA96JBE2_9MICO|nr:hypothetical protein [Demequina sp. PMTSA13]WNM28335.1 hypothetical protein RN607_04850 [Demequina sp. PMTSA13]